jgi:hypothetical protein
MGCAPVAQAPNKIRSKQPLKKSACSWGDDFALIKSRLPH